MPRYERGTFERTYAQIIHDGAAMTTKRSTAAHVNGRAIERAANVRLLIAELATRDMMREDVSNFLNFSTSGARKYVTELSEAGLIEVADHFGAKGRYVGLPIWRLVDDADLVQTFLDNLAAKPKRSPAEIATRPTRLELAQRDASRHFHLMREDAAFHVRVSRAQVVRDPSALPPEFFAASQGYCAPVAHEAEPRPVVLTAFETLGAVNFKPKAPSEARLAEIRAAKSARVARRVVREIREQLVPQFRELEKFYSAIAKDAP